MATNGHSRDYRGSGRGHNRMKMKKEGAKIVGIQRLLKKEEYEKEVAEIREQFKKLEKMIEESQRVGWLMKKKVKWHRLQMKKEQMIHAQQKERLHNMIEYLQKDLNTENSSETNRSNGFTSDKFCMFVGRTCGEGETIDVVTKEENGTGKYFENVQIGRAHV